MRRPMIVFGMNSMFAVQHLLPEILGLVRQQGFEVAVIAPGPERTQKPNGIPVGGCEVRFYSVTMEREMSPLSDLRALWQIWRILRALRPAITNMSTPKMALLGGLAAWLARVPHRIYTLRGLRYETTRSWKRAVLVACERIACACAHQVISISRSVQEAALEERLTAAEKVTVLGDRVSEGIAIPPSVEGQYSSLQELRVKTGIPKGSAVIGFVGRLTRDKGIHELVECFSALRRDGHSVHLLLLGDFEPGDPVDEATAAFIRSDPGVHWLGYVPQPRPYYQLMDVFVFPTHREGLGKVLLEAAAAGIPVVSTYTTGVIDVVQAGVTGLLVPPGDARALTRAAATLLGDGELAERMGKSARLLVQEHFDNSLYLERLGNMLRSLAHTDSGPDRESAAAMTSCANLPQGR